MPLALDENQSEDWTRGPPDATAEMMKPYAGEVSIWPVCSDVGNVRNNWPELMEKIELLSAA